MIAKILFAVLYGFFFLMGTSQCAAGSKQERELKKVYLWRLGFIVGAMSLLWFYAYLLK